MADLWNIGGALLGGLLGNQSSTQSTSNTQQPYAPAQPWIQSNINSGQNLQNQYQANPLSTGQIAAYGNSLGLTEGFRNQSGDLVKQMNSMNQFDRNNPTAKATQFNFTSAPTNISAVNEKLMASLPSASIGTLAQKAAQDNYGGLLGGGSSGSSNPSATNLTDAQWAAVKQMRDDVGWGNPFDTAGLQAMMALGSGSPLAAVGLIQKQMPYLDNYMAMKAAQEALARDQAAAAAAQQESYGGSGGGARSYFGGGYDGSGFAGVGSSGYGHTGYGDSNVSASSISEN